MGKKEKLDKIYDVIGFNNYIYEESVCDMCWSSACCLIMIWCLLEWLDNKDYENEIEKRAIGYTQESLLFRWKKKRESIDKQSKETIDFVFNLLIK